ncbi:phosphoglycerate mutase-like protein [Annulohypoxylon maeteangense]|uniref:phosphoglycerate mutase-like protein n=1 Tax=Annulohypoxylon maeteangense TaxID=1927788 RepID=UPI002008DD0D|nr:phosphoglycerate mutase-like protein [Annulohypoxylon maeteangense]KAI0884772.1 phosphoglycerate mutase-like protein [Annulohypoxylon maeteangense]
MAPTIDIIRHAEAHHNIIGSDIPDPRLTHRGLRQCLGLQKRYRKIDSGDNITHIISSPLRRAIETSLSIAQLAKEGTGITLNPQFQEVNATPSSTGTAVSGLLEQYPNANLDVTRMDENWYLKGPDTPFAPDVEKLETRALRARCFLLAIVRDLVNQEKQDARVVVVAHGEFAQWLTNDFVGTGYHRNSSWANGEVRSYQFEKLDVGKGDEVPLVETQESLTRRGITEAISLSDEQKAELKRIASIRVVSYASSYAESERREREAREEEEWVDVEEEEADKENTEPSLPHRTPRRRHRHRPSLLTRGS